MARRGSSGSLGPSMMAYFCLGICQSSKASTTGHVSLQEPTALCTGATATLNIVPHTPPHHLMLHRLSGGPHCNAGMLHHQEPHCHQEHQDPCPVVYSKCATWAASSHSAEGAAAASLDHQSDEEEVDPSISSTPAGFNL